MAKWFERKCCVGGQPTAPSRPGREELGAGQGQQEEWDVVYSRGQGLQEIEHARVRPVDVLEHEDRWLLPTERRVAQLAQIADDVRSIDPKADEFAIRAAQIRVLAWLKEAIEFVANSPAGTA